MPPYRPGHPARLAFGGYNPYQQKLWEVLDTVYHSHYFGYAETRQPTPGSTFDPTAYQAWLAKFDDAWDRESKRDAETRGLTSAELGENVMHHLYERFKRAQAEESKYTPWSGPWNFG